ncbi:LLM class flavin-dependent oxidoreductase [Jongsikchunia kroppenstedtii]|uniref:LLM class flavin-dependent oxidoreductase n=1 Tax=Jongsikchunia kroppenstedtii TaxID=1121721 RepID=UPI0003743FC8|nr:LLM class flavin-dependent oxidoreductase [Jongsikchunia kroppenstedtii]
MKVGVMIEPRLPGAVEFAQRAEQAGVDSLWAPEVWGYDALTGLAYVAAKTSSIKLGTFVVQLGSRSPALLATSAMSLQVLSGDRFRLGIGVSGPQVMEGWHGVRFTKPIATTRETIEIVRTVTRGDRLVHDGQVYQLPLPDGPGKALRPMIVPGELPIYVAAMGPANLRLTGAAADGWLGNTFMPETPEVFLDPIAEGAREAGRSLSDIDLVAPVALEFADDAAGEKALARKHAAGYAFTIGAMGAGGSANFYNNAFTRSGYGEAIAEVTRRWQSGDKDAARAAVPDDIGRRTNLLGTDEMIARRVGLHADAGIGTLLIKLDGDFDAQLAALRRLLAIIG